MNKPKSLDELLTEVPRDVVPPRNLWPAIAAGIAPRPNTRPMLMAASVAAAAACLASFFTWAVLRHAADPGGLPAVAQAQAPVYSEPTDERYVKAHAELEKTYEQRLALLDPATRTKIEASLRTIRKAREDIRRALQADPSSGVLEQLWESTSRDEIDLFDHVVQSTEPRATRS
jgi:hypothetical protein